jgi:hypothetical protein
MHVKKIAASLAVVAVALTFTASAFAGSLTTAYAGKASGAQGAVKATVAKSQPAVSKVAGKTAGTLPFTGVDLTVIVVGGTALLLVGFGLRRAARNKA